jgi:ELWxxDGT repeat protein
LLIGGDLHPPAQLSRNKVAMLPRHRHSARKKSAQQLRRRELKLEPLESRQLLAGVQLLGNLNPTPFHSNPNQLVSVGEETYFTASTAGGTTALWKTDGTTAGTTLVKDFADPAHQPQSLTNVGGTLFFTNYDEGGYELWKSDGTAAGTLQVQDIYAGQSGSYPQELTAVGSTLFFRAFDTGGSELWKSDGTAAGTVRVKDIVAGAGGSDPQELTNVNGKLFFSATTPGSGRELYRSGGSDATTAIVKDIFGGSGSSQPHELANVNGTLYFAATDATGGQELWRSAGTTATTWRFKDINVGGGDSEPADITPVSDSVFYFSAADATGGRELWRSDSTWAGTNRVEDIAAGSAGSYPTELTNVNGNLFFAASAQAGIGKLWVSAGSGVTEIGEFFVSPDHLINVSGQLMFAAVDATGGRELWKSDGLNAVFVKDIYPDSTGSYPDSFVNANGTLLFAATDNVVGRELWRSDGTPDGTNAIKDLIPGSESSHPANFVNVNGTIYFTATESSTGYELWKTDGTTAGTMLVSDIYPGGIGSSPSNLVNVGGKLFFAATDPYGGRELWTSNGTAAGTVIVKDLRTGLSSVGVPYSSSPTELTNLNGKLLFAAKTVGGVELCLSDGTYTGTSLLKDINSGSASSSPTELINVKGTLYFRASDAAGVELWKSNGTAAGTVMVRDIYAGAANSFPSHLTNVNGTLMFAATNAAGVELWKSNGTSTGTVSVRDVAAGSSSSVPLYLTNVAGTLFFSAKTSAAGRELWKSDGTSAGTVLVRDIFAGSGHSYPTGLTNVGGTLFFSAKSAAGGLELWKSEGTSASTIQVKDIVAGSSGSGPANLLNVNGLLFFSAKDQATGYELWKSDGTAGGTIRVVDLASGTVSSRPTNFGQGNNVLLLAATTLQGEELYALPPDPNVAPVLSSNPVPMFGPINEDVRVSAGSLVQYLVSSTQTDADANALKGVAVVAASTANGVWQYSLDGGTTWRAMGQISSTDARLLPANSTTRVRFIPKTNFNGPVWLGYRAWDRTQGIAGSLFDLTDHLGGTNAFSTTQKSARLMVNPVNDAPVLNTQPNPTLPELNEDSVPTSIGGALVRDLLFDAITDPDVGALEGIAVIDDGDGSRGQWQYSLNNGQAWQGFNLDDPDFSTTRLLAADDTTRVRFLPAANFSGSAVLKYRAWDRTQGNAGEQFDITATGGATAFSIATDVATQFVREVNDAPILDTTGQTMLDPLSTSGSNPGTLVKDLIEGHVTDADAGAVFGVAITNAELSSFGTWQFTLNNGATWIDMNVSSEFDAVLLPADDVTRVRFVPAPGSPSLFMRSLSYRAWDQTEGKDMEGNPNGFDCSGKLGGEHAFSLGKRTAQLNITP